MADGRYWSRRFNPMFRLLRRRTMILFLFVLLLYIFYILSMPQKGETVRWYKEWHLINASKASHRIADYKTALLPLPKNNGTGSDLLLTLAAENLLTWKNLELTQNSGKIKITLKSGLDAGAHAKSVCQNLTGNLSYKGNFPLPQMHYSSQYSLLYCPVEKVGSTFWRRVFYILYGKSLQIYNHPLEVPIVDALTQKYEILPRLVRMPNQVRIFLNNSFKFMFVRNPFSRILSAYVDKVFSPNPVYWKNFGIPSIRNSRNNASKHSLTCGHDATFPEFLRYVVESESTLRNRDSHFKGMTSLCKPCSVHYNFVGKMETFERDAIFLFHKLGMKSFVQAMSDKFTSMSVYDSIVDSIKGPYHWKRNIDRCIPFEQSQRRTWRKLQLKGIISMSQSYPFREDEVSKETFIHVAWNAHQNSSTEELKAQKKTVAQEAFISVPLRDLELFTNVFKDDFTIFEYDDSPEEYFNRTQNVQPVSQYLSFKSV
ncbi:hypothetical protein CHS0354_030248 [Potamilus streckersoni]|uniref:Carbohydrate sulfotransferase n=1 Tax=Potamilus streckersoni TaxID=2493646 RepID=A0AAE0RSP3_9BIVA|nr:hypothetical protein CHS0354_030248 [Potamilus streckersoni]